jgi:hypothetical protein
MANTRSTDCWLIPLTGDNSPEKKALDNPNDCAAYETLIIPVSILNTFKKADSLKSAGLTYSTLRHTYQRGSKQTILKNMGAPFGKGIFAGPQGFLKGDILVYSGFYFLCETGSTQRSEQVYLSQVTESTNVDAKNVENQARYLQHLPDGDDPFEKRFLTQLNTEIATANLLHSSFYVSITLDDEDYLIPVSVCIATRNIAANEIMGYSYGMSYWNLFAAIPTLFNLWGKPIDVATLQLRTHDGIDLRFAVKREAVAIFQKSRCVTTQMNALIILASDIKLNSEGEANGIHVPALYYISSPDNKKFIETVSDNLSVFFDCTYPQTHYINHCLGFLNIPATINSENGFFRISILVNDLAKLTLSQAEKAFTELNKTITKGDCQFEAFSTKAYRKAVVANSGMNQRFFNTGNSLAGSRDKHDEKSTSLRLESP